MSDIDHQKTRNLMYLNTALAMLRAINCYSHAERAQRDINRFADQLDDIRYDLEKAIEELEASND